MSRARSVADIHDGSTDITTLGTVTAGTIGSGVTFPAGHVLQVVFHKLASGETGGQPSYSPATDFTFGSFSTAFKKSITPLKADSHILILYSLTMGCSSDVSHQYFRLYDNTNTNVIGTEGGHGLFGAYTSYRGGYNYGHTQISGSYLYENPTIPSTPIPIEIEVLSTIDSAADTNYLNRRGYGTTYGALTSTLTLMEIAV